MDSASPLIHTHPFAGLQILSGVLPQAHQKFPQYHPGKIPFGCSQVLLTQHYPANRLRSFFSVLHEKFLAQADSSFIYNQSILPLSSPLHGATHLDFLP